MTLSSEYREGARNEISRSEYLVNIRVEQNNLRVGLCSAEETTATVLSGTKYGEVPD